MQKFKFPGDVQVIDFDTNESDSMSMMVYAIGSLKYSVHQKINRDEHKCDSNATMESFTSCVFSKFNDSGCTAIITKIGNTKKYHLHSYFLSILTCILYWNRQEILM